MNAGNSTISHQTPKDSSGRRSALSDRLRAFVGAWEEGDMESILRTVTTEGIVISSAHGSDTRADRFAHLLMDTDGRTMSLEMFNEFASTNSSRGVAATSVLGVISNEAGLTLQFGASLTAEAKLHIHGWRFTTLRLQVLWVQGDLKLVSHWRLPSDVAIGDSVPVSAIISEIDAPWRLAPHAVLPLDINDQLADAFYRFAWSMDFADYELMRSCLTDEISGDFALLGNLTGIRQVIGAFKAYRQIWPHMQHLGRVVHIDSSSNGYEARIIVGRILPGEARYSHGQEVYGAHYDLHLLKFDEQWLIHRFSYRPGMVRASNWGRRNNKTRRIGSD